MEGKQIDLSLSDNIIRIGLDTNSYEASLISDYLRNLLIAKEETFSFETVMSHPSKLDTLKKSYDAGFKNYLYFIATESPDINVRRVEQRVEKGGHAVEPKRIIDRYFRTLDLVVSMLPYCHRCFIIDNSSDEEARLIAEVVDNDTIIIHTDGDIPVWVDTYVFEKLGV